MRRVLGITVVVGLMTMLVPSATSAKPVRSQLGLIVFGLLYPDGGYEYDFGAGVETAKGTSRCRKGRKISVFREEPVGPDTLIGSRRTDAILQIAVIRWRNPDPDTIAGDYYAKVKQEVKRKGPGTMKCLADRSQTVSLSRPGFAPEAPPRGWTREEGIAEWSASTRHMPRLLR